jgi:hypothetical protein
VLEQEEGGQGTRSDLMGPGAYVSGIYNSIAASRWLGALAATVITGM